MRINEQDLKKIKALHVALKMPVWVLDEKTNEILKSYTSIYKYPISYEFKKRIIAQNAVEFYSGIMKFFSV